MSIQKHLIKRVSPPTFFLKLEENYYKVSVRFNQAPTREWIDLFKQPSMYKPDEAHPRAVEIVGAKLIWETSIQKIIQHIEWLDKYIKQANEKYSLLFTKRRIDKRKTDQQKKQEKEELKRLTERFKDL